MWLWDIRSIEIVKEAGAGSMGAGGGGEEIRPCAREVVGLHTVAEGVLGCARVIHRKHD